MYKISNLLFNIKNNQPNLKDNKIFNYYFPNFDSIIYFFSIAKKETLKNIDLNYIIETGLHKYKPNKKDISYLFRFVIFFDNINHDLIIYLYNQIKDILIYQPYEFQFPHINNFAYKLMFNDKQKIIVYENFENISHLSYNKKDENELNSIKKVFFNKKIYPDKFFLDLLNIRKICILILKILIMNFIFCVIYKIIIFQMITYIFLVKNIM